MARGDTRTPEQKVDGEQTRAEVVRLRNAGRTFQQIGDELGFTKQHANALFWDAMKEATRQEVAAYRAAALERYDHLRATLHDVLERDHIAVSQGRVVRVGKPVLDEETGEPRIEEGHGAPVLDDMPKIAAARALLQLEDREAKLLGLDTPVTQRLGTDLTVRYVVEGVDTEALT